MLTLKHLIAAKPNSPAAKAGKKVLDTYLAAFKLGQKTADEKTLPGRILGAAWKAQRGD